MVKPTQNFNLPPVFMNPTSACSLSRLSVQGMTEAEEDKLLALKDFMLKSNKAKANMGDTGHLGDAGQTGVIDLGTLGITGRQVDLVKPKTESDDKRGGKRFRSGSCGSGCSSNSDGSGDQSPEPAASLFWF